MRVTIYDNGGETVDRYTVIIGQQVFSMDKTPPSHRGINHYWGKMSDGEVGSIGVEIRLKRLPKAVQVAVKQRIDTILKGERL